MGLLSAEPIADSAVKVAFLRASNALDGVHDVIETHMSWVFLTERHAFKLKKPVKLPYIDFRTIERRRKTCEKELRLGRRLAPDVYIAVVPLVSAPAGLAIGPCDGDVVDWLVVMRRLASRQMLPQMLARGVANDAHADAVGDLLARFYADARRASWNGGEYRRRLHEQVVSVGHELLARGAPRESVGVIVRDALDCIDHDANALDARIAGGRVVDAHGDLRPEHVCLETPPVVIDPLEFDDDLRTLDVASELAFFTLECDRLGARWFADRVVARCLAGDTVPPALFALYRRQHALTRALIALRRVDEGDAPRWQAKAADYLARATLTEGPR